MRETGVTLQLGTAPTKIPNGTVAGNVSVAGTLNLGSFSDTINGLSGTGTIDGVSGTPTLTGDNNATGQIYSGIIKNTAGSLAITKIGSGIQNFTTSTNTYSGGTTLTLGTLSIGNGANENATALGLASSRSIPARCSGFNRAAVERPLTFLIPSL